jgi:hypothetical protein
LEQEIDRMRCKHGMLLAFLIVGLVGCQGSTDPGEAAAPAGAPGQAAGGPQARHDPPTGTFGASDETVVHDTSEPAAAVAVFLDAVRRGDDEKILQLYTVRARQEATRLKEHFAPKGSDTAQFTVGNVEYLAEDGARVACTWSDLDQVGQRHTMEFLWTLRREPQGWRVAGMVATPFPGEDPVLLDFENLDETIQKVNLLAEEIRRREETGTPEALEAKKSEDPVRR